MAFGQIHVIQQAHLIQKVQGIKPRGHLAGRFLVVVFSIVFLSACVSSGGPRGGVSGGVNTAPASGGSTDGIRPHYKVGNPYQIAGKYYYPAKDENYSEIGVASWYGPNFNHRPTANGELFDMNALTAAHRTLPLPSIVEVTHLGNGRTIRVRVNDRGPFSRDRIIDLSREAAGQLGMIESGTAQVKVTFVREASLDLAITRKNDRKAIKAIADSLKGSGRRLRRDRKTNSNVSARSTDRDGESITDLIAQNASEQPSEQRSDQRNETSRQIGSGQIPNYGALPVIETSGFEASGANRVGSPVRNTRNISVAYQIQVGSFLDPNRAERLSLLLGPSGPVFIQTELTDASRQQSFYKVFMGPYSDKAHALETMEALRAAGYRDARLVETGTY